MNKTIKNRNELITATQFLQMYRTIYKRNK